MLAARKYLDQAVEQYRRVLIAEGKRQSLIFLDEVYTELSNTENVNSVPQQTFLVRNPRQLGEVVTLCVLDSVVEMNLSFKLNKIESRKPVFITLLTNAAQKTTLDMLLEEGEELLAAGHSPAYIVICNNCSGEVASAYSNVLGARFSLVLGEVLNYRTSLTSNFENLGQASLRAISSPTSKMINVDPSYVISIDDDIAPVHRSSFLKALQLAQQDVPILSGLAIPILDGSPFSIYKDSFRSFEVVKQVSRYKPIFYGAFHIYPYQKTEQIFSPLVPYDQQLAFESMLTSADGPFAFVDLAFRHKESDTLWSWIEKKRVGYQKKKEYCTELGKIAHLEANEYALDLWNERAIGIFAEMRGAESKVVVGTRLINTYLRRGLQA